jgi:hypothetical protein
MPHDAPIIDPDRADGLSGTHRRTLEKLFQHPLTHNLSWREVTSLCQAIGTAEHRHNGDLLLGIGEEQLVQKPAHRKDLDASEVMDLRHLLIRAGWAAKSSDQATPAASAEPDVMIVVDHAGARLYALHAESRSMAKAAAEQTHHLRHQHIDGREHDADREEHYPADTHFFAGIAAAVPTGGRIVVVGHGKGQSNEAAHLIAYLGLHHRDIQGRIVGNIVADLGHLTVPQTLQMARDALKTAPKAAPDAR